MERTSKGFLFVSYISYDNKKTELCIRNMGASVFITIIEYYNICMTLCNSFVIELYRSCIVITLLWKIIC